MKFSTIDFESQLNAGELDSLMPWIRSKLDERKTKLTGAPTMSQLRRGDTVWFNQHVRPTYLINVECKIVKINRVRVSVEIKESELSKLPFDCRFARGPIRTSLNLLTTQKP